MQIKKYYEDTSSILNIIGGTADSTDWMWYVSMMLKINVELQCS